jgi:hypothetical protein
LFGNIFRLQCNPLQTRIQRLDRYFKIFPMLEKTSIALSQKILVQKFEEGRYNISMNLLFVIHQFFLSTFVQQDWLISFFWLVSSFNTFRFCKSTLCSHNLLPPFSFVFIWLATDEHKSHTTNNHIQLSSVAKHMKMKLNGGRRLCEHKVDLQNLKVLKDVTNQKKLDAYESILLYKTRTIKNW